MTTLRLFFEDGWPDAVPALDWGVLGEGGREGRHGRGVPADWPVAAEYELVLPAGRTVFVDAALPAAGRPAEAALLGFALEETLLNEPTANLYHAGALGDDGRCEVAVTEAADIRRVLAVLRDAGRVIERIVPEECLLPRPAADEWRVAATAGGFIVRRGLGAARFVPAGETAVPLLARLLRADMPRAVEACGDEAADWWRAGAALTSWVGELRVTPAGIWRLARTRDVPDFARGELDPRRRWRPWGESLRRALYIAGLSCTVGVAGLLVRAGWQGGQSARLSAQIDAVAQRVVGTPVAADQRVRRAISTVDRLRVSRGLPARDGALEALGALGAVGNDALHVQSLDYRDGRWVLHVAPPSAGEVDAWRERLAPAYVMVSRPLAGGTLELQIMRGP